MREKGFPSLQKAHTIWSETSHANRTGKLETILRSPEVADLLSRDISYFRGEGLARIYNKYAKLHGWTTWKNMSQYKRGSYSRKLKPYYDILKKLRDSPSSIEEITNVARPA